MFVERVRAAVEAGRLTEPVVVVVEGAARGGVAAGTANGVAVVHAAGSGDDTLVAVTADADTQVTLVSADRALCQRVRDLGAEVKRPGWLLELLDG
jgi:carbon monoxide dehydrogenase subunit G